MCFDTIKSLLTYTWRPIKSKYTQKVYSIVHHFQLTVICKFKTKYSLEGHQFAVFGFVLTNDLRYMVSISTRFITWDLSTSDLQRDVNPGIEGIMQQLVLSPDNKWAAAYSNNNQTVLLNMLSSEFVIVENPFGDGENVTGVFLLNQKYLHSRINLISKTIIYHFI